MFSFFHDFCFVLYAKQTTTFFLVSFLLFPQGILSRLHGFVCVCDFNVLSYQLCFLHGLSVQESVFVLFVCARQEETIDESVVLFIICYVCVCVKWDIKTANKSTLGELITILIVSIGYLFYFIFFCNITSFVFNFIFILFLLYLFY